MKLKKPPVRLFFQRIFPPCTLIWHLRVQFDSLFTVSIYFCSTLIYPLTPWHSLKVVNPIKSFFKSCASTARASHKLSSFFKDVSGFCGNIYGKTLPSGDLFWTDKVFQLRKSLWHCKNEKHVQAYTRCRLQPENLCSRKFVWHRNMLHTKTIAKHCMLEYNLNIKMGGVTYNYRVGSPTGYFSVGLISDQTTTFFRKPVPLGLLRKHPG